MISYIKECRLRYKSIAGKLASGEGNSDCIFDHHNHTPDWLVDLFWHGKTFATFATCNIEFLFHKNILSCKHIVVYLSCNIKEQVARKYLTKLGIKFTIIKYTYNFKDSKIVYGEESMVKFDGIFINSPYSIKAGASTNTTDVYPDWNKKFLPMATNSFASVTPRNWANKESDSFRKFVFQQNSLKELSYLPDNTFSESAVVGTCYIICDKSTNDSIVKVTDKLNNSLDIVHSDDSVIPWGDIRWMSIFDKIKKFPTMDTMWNRGKLNLNELDSISSEDGVELVKAIGVQSAPIEIVKIKSGYENTGFGYFGVGVPNVGTDGKKIGCAKILSDSQVVGHSVVKLGKPGMTKAEAIRLQTYIDSRLVKKIVSVKKGGSTPNAKHLFSFIPVPDLTKDFNEQEFFKQLGFDKNERALFND